MTTSHSQTPPIHPIVPPIRFNDDQGFSPFHFPRENDDQVKRAKIMVVDDDETTTLAIRKYLSSAGFLNILLETDSRNALQRIGSELPDLVLLDLIMPVNGMDILQEIRNDSATRMIPILSLTSSDDDYTRARLLNLGANDFLQKPVCGNELVARVRNTLSSKVAYDKLASRSAKLEADVLTDPLTNIANRRAFDFELDRKIIEWERQRTPFSLLLIDIDFFKSINDQHGHKIGDETLAHVAETIGDATRRMDLVCRIGGEEFAVILPVTRNCESNQASERIRRAFEESPIVVEAQTLPLTVTIGIANAMKGDDADVLFKRADTALYAGKQRGRNCSTLHDGSKCVAMEETQRDRVPTTLNADSIDLNIVAARIMVIDDEPSTVAVVKKYLNGGGFDRIETEVDSTKAFDRIADTQPDLVLLDIRMPNVTGLEVIEQMRRVNATQRIPVVFLTSSTDTNTKVQALNLGANDFLQKPINASELLARVRNTLMAKAHVDLLASYSSKLEQEVEIRTKELVASRREAIQCLARAAEIRDDKTGQHVLRVGRYAAIIAKELGFTGQQIIDLEHAAQLHDVGKIGVPDAILNKADKLTDEEFDRIKAHCRTGSLIMSDQSGIEGGREVSIGHILEQCVSPVMRLAALVAETHHEKWDGSGYPRGLAGEEIPIEGRITAVCDVFDAVSTERPYKKAFPLEKCFRIIAEGCGTHFDPNVVEAFFRSHKKIIETYQQYGASASEDDS
ncbi:MAG: response regulator [Planctomycetota bacterium]